MRSERGDALIGTGLGCAVQALVVILLFASSSAAQPNMEDVAALQARIQAIRANNAVFKARLQQQREVTASLLQRASVVEGREEALLNEVQRVVGPQTLPPQESTGTAGLPQLTWGGSGEFRYMARFVGADEVYHGFNHRGVGFFLTSEVTDRVTALLESRSDFRASLTDQVVEYLEQAKVRYAVSDALALTLGMGRTPLGHWSQAYPIGWLQPTILHPAIYEPELPGESIGGILPIHSTGVTASGLVSCELADLTYSLGLYNGRPLIRHLDGGGGSGDNNDWKAVNVMVGVTPHALGPLDGVAVGFDVYVDTIPSFRDQAIRREEIDEIIIGGYTTYLRDKWEVLMELFHINHDDNDSERTFKTLGGYVQAGYQIRSKVMPYYRFEFIDVGNGDPYYAFIDESNALLDRNPIPDHHKHTVGVRWDALPWNAIKFEYSFAGNHKAEDEHALAASTSFAF